MPQSGILIVGLICSQIPGLAMAQSVGTEPSPMEAFAATPGVHAVWTGDALRLDQGATSAVISALSLEDRSQPSHRMSGILVELSAGAASDKIYLDEEAAERTRAALIEIADSVARRPMPNGCMGAREFWPLYNWPWNKYHELNADFCDGMRLVLSGRGRTGSFAFPNVAPADLAGMLARAMDQLKQRR